MSNKSRFLYPALTAFLIGTLAAGVRLCGAQEEFLYDEESRRNPFIALVTSDGRLVKFNDRKNFELIVEGIVMGVSGDSYALVSGSIVRQGDLVGGYEVVSIEKKKVIFQKDGQLKEVEFTTEEGEK